MFKSIWKKIKQGSRKTALFILVLLLVANIALSVFMIISEFSFGIPGFAVGINSVIILLGSNLLTVLLLLIGAPLIHTMLEDQAELLLNRKSAFADLELANVNLTKENDQLKSQKQLWSQLKGQFCARLELFDPRNSFYEIKKEKVDVMLLKKLGILTADIPEKSWWESKDTTFDIIHISTRRFNVNFGIDLADIKYKVFTKRIKLAGVNITKLDDVNASKEDLSPIEYCFILKTKNGKISMESGEEYKEVIDAFTKYHNETHDQAREKTVNDICVQLTTSIREKLADKFYPYVEFVDEYDNSFKNLTGDVNSYVSNVLMETWNMALALKEGASQAFDMQGKMLNGANED